MNLFSEIANLQGQALTEFIIAQAIGVIMAILGAISGQLSNFRHVLIIQITLNLLLASSTALMSGVGGALIALIATVMTVVFFILKEKKIEMPRWGLVLSALAFIAAGVYGALHVDHSKWLEILPILGSLCYLGGVSSGSMTRYRLFFTGNSLVWLIYDLSIGTYANMLTHGFLLFSFAIGFIRLDVLKKGEKKEA